MRSACTRVLVGALRRAPRERLQAGAAGALGRCWDRSLQVPCSQTRSFSVARPVDSARAAGWRRRAAQLQRSHESEPDNPQRFADLLRALNHFDPQQAIRRFESQEPQVAFAHNIVKREYIRALVLANRLDFVDLDQLFGQQWHQVSHSASAISAAHVAAAGAGASAAGAGPVELRLPTGADPIKVQIADSHKRSFWRLLRTSITMLILVAGVSVFAEGMAGNVQKGFGMGSKKITPVEDVNTTFDDVKGCNEVKDELQEIVQYLKDPNRFTRLGAKLPKGVLMSGAPGTGKTLLARAIAGEAGVPFFQASGSEFEEMFVGVGARRVRDMFAEARKQAPCIVFLDEVDAVGSKRANRDNTASRMTLNQLLVELDGFEQNDGVVVICATNFPESLDKALTRPGRLDKQVVVPVPDLKGRVDILELYAQKLVLAENVNLETLARRTAGMTGADLANILNIAAVRAAGNDHETVSMKYLEEAFDRVVVGLERTNPMSDVEKRLTAYHEGGHTLVSMGSKGVDPVHKATIMPRGNALGITWSIPEGEKYSERVFELQARLDVLMGGKAAEELIFGPKNVTAGCTSDLRQATSLARRMVMNFGMADESMPAPIYMDMDEYAVLSDEAKHDIDVKTQALMSNAYARAAEHLRRNEKQLHSLAEALVEYETLSAEEIQLAVDFQNPQIAVNRSEKEAAQKGKVRKVPAATEAQVVSKKPPSKRKAALSNVPNPVVEDGAEGTE